MKPIQKVLELEGRDYYTQHLNILNGIFPVQLAKKEIEVLATFLALDKTITEGDRFNTLARKKVKKALNLSPGGLSNYLGAMKRKGYLRENEITGKISLHPFVEAGDKEQVYLFRLKKLENES